ncbi:MAG: heme exporter protein CcmB [Vicingaceae bacterium]
MLNEITTLLKKDFTSEFRQKATLNGILLYVASTVFIAYQVFNAIEELTTWIALFWIILVFASTNASINSFKAESSQAYYYYYSLCSASSIIFSKLIFNASLLLVTAGLTFGLFVLLMGNPIENSILFSLVLLLGILAIASTLTLVSAIASKTNNNSTLTAILSFPILLPVLLTAIKASVLCGLGFGWEDCVVYVSTLGLLNLLTIALSYVLFPYLWRS